MKLKDLLKIVYDTSVEFKTSVPYICGGIPRDKLINKLENISDIDITTGDDTVKILAKECFFKINKIISATYKVSKDGHSTIYTKSKKIDFSSNFNCKNIEGYLKDKGVSNLSPMNKEVYSRDFTCNSLLMTLDLRKIIDPTRNGIKDINNKIIRTNLDPSITLTSNQNRVIRSVYLASKLDFQIDDQIVDWVRKNPDYVRFCSENALTEKINAAMQFNKDKTIFYLDKMKLWNHIPINDSLYPYYKNRSIK